MGLVSKKCIELIKEFESYHSKPYYDIAGVKTLGYGMTGEEIKGLVYISEEEASNMLEKIINDKYALPIKNDLDSKNVTLTQNQFDAIVSMAYNIGIYGLFHSTLYRNICNGIMDSETIKSNFEMWCKYKEHGIYKTSIGLLKRRRREAELFLGDNHEDNSNNIDGTLARCTGNGVRVRSDLNRFDDENILGKLYKGDTVKLFKRIGDWYEIYYGDNGGYVFAKYIEPIE